MILRKGSVHRMRLLVIEDDRKISSFLEKGFKEAGYAVDVASDGVEGLHLAESGIYDAAVVDIMLPGLDGLSLIQQLRSKQDNTPVVILSAKRSVDDRIKGLQRGGDDYMVKPFSFSELLARIQALVRRSSQTVAPSSLEFEGLSVDLLAREITREGQKIELQPREFALLEYRAWFEDGGLPALKARFDEELAARMDVFFVRVTGTRDQVLFMSVPLGHERFDAAVLNRIKPSGQVSWYTIPLEGPDSAWVIGSTALGRGVMLQVGKSAGHSV